MNGYGKILWTLALCGVGAAAYYVFKAQSSANSGNADGAAGAGDQSGSGTSGGAASDNQSALEGIGQGIADTAKEVGYNLGIYTPRGLRNNNPGNLRYVASIQWNGQTGDDGDGYAVFDTMENGVRALGHQLTTYAGRGLNTVQEIITTFAPSSENDTAAYVTDVAGELGVDANQSLDVNGILPQLAAAIIHHENGVQPLALSDIQTWVYEA